MWQQLQTTAEVANNPFKPSVELADRYQADLMGKIQLPVIVISDRPQKC